MEELLKKAKNILENVPPRRPSYFQLATMLVGREPTHQSKLWRILEEVKSKVSELDGAKDQIADYYDQIEIMKCDLQEIHDDNEIRKEAKIRMAKRRIDASFANIVKIREVMVGKQEEIDFLLNMFNELSEIEKVKSWDDKKSQEEYWEKKLGTDISLRSVLKLPPDLEAVKTVLSLPDSIGLKKVLHKSIGALIEGK